MKLGHHNQLACCNPRLSPNVEDRWNNVKSMLRFIGNQILKYNFPVFK